MAATIFQHLHRLTYWLIGGTDTQPPRVPLLPQFRPLIGEVILFLNLRGKLDPSWTRERVMNYVDDSITDRELQAHVLAYLRDRGMVFDPKLNPHAPMPAYVGEMMPRTTTAGTQDTEPAADARSAFQFKELK
ncbi:hypothetical protein CSUI_009373 [Cystoisospora suis]|uniref:Uncharacterized protein n=1 Tax=Cystoisospora suis TaxID=483139 RepID=A0A2C6KJJ5_9APIC|nr:hypothetical protein CSUI_009373 [Cystoisospora suis]